MIFNVIILAILFAIIMWMGLKDGEEKHLEEIKALILSTSQANSDYTRAVDVEAVADAVRYNGFDPTVDGQIVTFECNGTRFGLSIENLPFVNIRLVYRLSPEWNKELLKKAASEVTYQYELVKVYLAGDSEDVLFFQIESLENTYLHLRGGLDTYIRVLFESSKHVSDIYERTSKMENGASSEDLNGQPMTLPQSNGWVS